MADAPAVIAKTDTATSWKTTIAGIIAAIGLVGDELTRSGWPDDLGDWIAFVLKALGPVLIGLFARDSNVTSEGHKVAPPSVKS